MAGLNRELILDTNVALAWLLFDDPLMHPIRDAIQAQQWHWSATPTMREEFIHVLSYPTLSRHLHPHAHAHANVRATTLIETWDHWVHLVPEPQEPPPLPRLRCTDPDDQCFIDLALTRHATLITRDKALLALARRAVRDHCTQVIPPTAWSTVDSPRLAPLTS